MTPANHPAGTLCWFDCGSKNAAQSRSFYTKLFGWSAVDAPMPDDTGVYTLFKLAGEDVAGLYELRGPECADIPSHWMTYVSVPDVDDAVRRARTLGGTVRMEPGDVPGVGRMAVLQDPTGAVFAVAHFDQHPGTRAHGPFGWSELATRDPNRAAVFYSELLGWGAKPDPKLEYTEFQTAGRSVAGMMAMKEEHGEAPSHWMPYVMVDDCDAIARRATELGGRLFVPPTDIPGVGRFAVLADPAGAALGTIKLLPE